MCPLLRDIEELAGRHVTVFDELSESECIEILILIKAHTANDSSPPSKPVGVGRKAIFRSDPATSQGANGR